MDNKALGDKLRLLFRNSVERVMLQIERALVPLAQGTTQTRLTWKSLGIDLSDQVFAQAVVDHINNNEKIFLWHLKKCAQGWCHVIHFALYCSGGLS